MPEQESPLDRERRLRQAAVTAAMRQPPEPPDPDAAEPEAEDDSAPAQRMEQQALWVDVQIRRAMERGEFDNLPGAGKPLRLPDRHDPDWWVKSLIEREQITGVLPPALALRKEDAGLDADLDRATAPRGRPPGRRGLQPPGRRRPATAAGRAARGHPHPRRRGGGGGVAASPRGAPRPAARAAQVGRTGAGTCRAAATLVASQALISPLHPLPVPRSAQPSCIGIRTPRSAATAAASS